MCKKVVFLDRDGVINKDSPDYIKSLDELTFLPGSLRAIAQLTEHGFTVIVITNQSAVNRGIIPLHTLERIHGQLRSKVLSRGGRIKDILFCPHRPDQGCDCRKPKPGLIYRAQQKYGIDLATSVMVGDSARDILCGKNAGCGRTVLVKTGDSETAESLLTAQGVFPGHTAENFSKSIDWIITTTPTHHL